MTKRYMFYVSNSIAVWGFDTYATAKRHFDRLSNGPWFPQIWREADVISVQGEPSPDLLTIGTHLCVRAGSRPLVSVFELGG